MSSINRNPAMPYCKGNQSLLYRRKNLCEKYAEGSFHFFASALLVGGIRPWVAQEAIGSILQRV